MVGQINEVEYMFWKRNGDIRVLRGTRDFGEFSKQNPTTWNNIKPKGIRNSNPHNITLIDLEINEWRSIKPETIIAKREVKPFNPTFHVHDYERMNMKDIIKLSTKKTTIKKNRIPYFMLMILNSAPMIMRNDLEVMIEHIAEKKGMSLKRRDGHMRAFSRAFHTFFNNGLIKKLNREGNYFKITEKGKYLLSAAVK